MSTWHPYLKFSLITTNSVRREKVKSHLWDHFQSLGDLAPTTASPGDEKAFEITSLGDDGLSAFWSGDHSIYFPVAKTGSFHLIAFPGPRAGQHVFGGRIPYESVLEAHEGLPAFLRFFENVIDLLEAEYACLSLVPDTRFDGWSRDAGEPDVIYEGIRIDRVPVGGHRFICPCWVSVFGETYQRFLMDLGINVRESVHTRTLESGRAWFQACEEPEEAHAEVGAEAIREFYHPMVVANACYGQPGDRRDFVRPDFDTSRLT